MVVRAVDDTLNLYFYTDSRSQKAQAIKNDPRAQVTMYHHQKGYQILLSGSATIETLPANSKQKIWDSLSQKSRQSYTTSLAPGTPIDQAQEAYKYLDTSDDQYFCVIKLEPSTIEYLQLNSKGHLRAIFHKNKAWEGSWLVP